jgi:glyoxylase I family protein
VGGQEGAEAFKILFGGVVMTRGNLIMGLRPMVASGDRFDPNRVGFDYLSFSVASREDLEHALRLFDEPGIPHGQITTFPSFGLGVLPFEDPDGAQFELTAPTA